MADDFGIGSAYDPNQGATISGVPSGAMPTTPQAAAVNVFDVSGRLVSDDLRVRIRVPANYITPSTVGSLSKELQSGIVFPYTPSITYDTVADYTTINPTHSNYTQYFYNHTKVNPINITGKWTVQNSKDAAVYLATKHLLSALTKMRYGDEPAAGSPPPVCRLDAYGSYMMKNIPIVINSFRIELPNEVDYFKYDVANDLTTEIVQSIPDQNSSGKVGSFGNNLVPILSTITLTCYPIYSRREMLQFTVSKFLEEYDKNTKYL